MKQKVHKIRDKNALADISISYPYSLYKKWRSKWLTWFHFGRHSSVELDPFRLLWIDPSQVKYKQNNKKELSPFGYSVSTVKNGGWDLLKSQYEDWPIYQAFKKVFKEQREWEDTEWYNKNVQRIQVSDKIIFKSTSKKDFDRRCKEIERIYDGIAEHGYKTQKEVIESSQDYPAAHTWMRFCPELHEVTVNIARDGEFIFTEGRTRFTIAKLLSIESIPVRVHVRHSNWNKIREEFVYTSNHHDYQDHPDIRYLA